MAVVLKAPSRPASGSGLELEELAISDAPGSGLTTHREEIAAMLTSLRANFVKRLEADPLSELDESTRFLNALDDGRIQAESLDAKVLKDLYEAHLLLFREPNIFGPVLASVKLPLDPVECGKKPIVFVELDDGRLIVMNGNHRTYKILTQNSSDEQYEHPLLCVKLGKETFEEIFSYRVTQVRMPDGQLDWGVSTPNYLPYSPRGSQYAR
ncbi:MAG: hypothetical protein J5J00_10770 [Deltaproteobacteria bacterium]|nr:hypothetical protein [Deltaproteobacteria bacterium]